MVSRPTSPSRLALILLAFLLVAAATPLAAGPPPVVVDETNSDWGFLDETGTPMSGYVEGPGTPPLGGGSGMFGITDSADGVVLGTQLHAGLRLADITALSYATYQSASPQAPALQMNIDYDDTDATTTWQGRLVYEPYYTQTIPVDTWQSWDTLTTGANWWSSGTPIVGDASSPAACVISSPCTWAEVLAAYPNAAIQQGVLAGLLFKAGSGWPAGWTGHVDQLVLTGTGVDVIYDIDTIVPVTLQSFSVD
ncbi:MAG: hypothetical protein AAGC60_13095 [Acidobacteriota bacterium]